MLWFYEEGHLVNEKVQMEIIGRLMVVCSKGFCILQCFPNHLKILIRKNSNVKIGETILI